MTSRRVKSVVGERRQFTRAAAVLLLLASGAGAVTPISWDQAEHHVGEQAVVEGEVVDVHCSPLSCLLAFEATFSRFTAVVPANRFDVLPPDELSERFAGRRVRVSGTIRTIDSKPEIVVDTSEALVLAEPVNPPDAAAAAEAERLERLTVVLERIERLTEELAATQQRMAVVLSALEERTARLASAPLVEPPSQPAMNTGAPKPRPGYQALRTVKRGMSQGDVERLIGAPDNVEYGSGGWVTWYYAFGNSVSFDSRGRAQSLVGFPNP